MSVFSERIKELRKKNGWSQDDLALRLGATRSAVGNYEQGTREPDFDMLEKMATVLNVDVAYLIGQNNYVERLHGTGIDPEDADILLRVTPDELSLIKAYRLLDDDSKKLIWLVAKKEDN